MQACFWLLACATLFTALLNAFSVCRAHELVDFITDCEIGCDVRLTSGLSKDIDFERSQAVVPQVPEIKRVKNYEPAGTPFDEVPRNDSQDSSKDSTGQTSVSGKRVLGSAVFVGESLVPFLTNASLTTAIDDLPRTGSEDPSRDLTEQTSVSPKRALGSVVVVGESLMPSLETSLSLEVVRDVAQRIEYPQYAVSARQDPVFKAELCELESRLGQEISGIIEQLTLDIDGVKRMLGRVEDTVSTKDMGEEVNQRLGWIEESFLKVSDLVRYSDSTTPEIESLEAHFTQLREQVASVQAELRRNNQGVVEIGGAFGNRLDDLEGILQQVITKWESDQSEMAQRLSHLQGFPAESKGQEIDQIPLEVLIGAAPGPVHMASRDQATVHRRAGMQPGSYPVTSGYPLTPQYLVTQVSANVNEKQAVRAPGNYEPGQAGSHAVIVTSPSAIPSELAGSLENQPVQPADRSPATTPEATLPVRTPLPLRLGPIR